MTLALPLYLVIGITLAIAPHCMSLGKPAIKDPSDCVWPFTSGTQTATDDAPTAPIRARNVVFVPAQPEWLVFVSIKYVLSNAKAGSFVGIVERG